MTNHNSQLTKITAIILAAGYSSRMGDFKPLMRLGEMTILERQIRLFQSAGVMDIRVVAGHRSSDILNVLGPLNVRGIVNEQYAEGMFSSVLAGIKSLEPDREAFFILPVDIPLVRRQTVLDLLKAFEIRNSKLEAYNSESAPDIASQVSSFKFQVSSFILYPNFQGERGHPPLIASAYVDEIIRWSGQGGLRAFLEQYEKDAADVEVADECMLLDLDTPADYQQLLKRYDKYEIPTSQECVTLMTKTFAVKERVFRHCQTVARVALRLGEELNRAGCHIDLELLTAAGLLHDLAREKPAHAAEGARILNEMGYCAVAEVVSEHMDIILGDEETISVKEILYLADKLTQGDRIVSEITKRFEQKMAHYANDPEIIAAIKQRLDNALRIKQRFENMTGTTLETVLAEIHQAF
ncbi:NTP transferase domain-containing protein [Desulfonema magnum]|uniref:NTP transferase domain-containing protein, HD domain-containing n=1 Tax=Desulfonema magnum TaxID=45655 RepID=A0A975GSE5_9BACT|nr:NTP transferase domain-containing protein [Desulfonema magnum]QTA91949.1 NTP transferase domain-containing protein, HD domain-containing [Desulfonema magnum]